MSTISPSPRVAFDSLEQEAYLNLWRTYDRLRADEEAMFARVDLTAQQYNTLRLLATEHPGVMRTLDIAARLISRAPDITRLLDRLEQRGFIVRDRPAENRRVVEVAITPAGLSLLRQLRSRVIACHKRQLGHLSRKRLKELIDILKAARMPHETTARISRPS